jgi:hypothetical protein
VQQSAPSGFEVVRTSSGSSVVARRRSRESLPARRDGVVVHPSHPFEIVWRTSPAEEPIVLRSAADANEATMAFHEELARLRRQDATGELMMRKGIDGKGIHAQPPLLRQFHNHHKHHAS